MTKSSSSKTPMDSPPPKHPSLPPPPPSPPPPPPQTEFPTAATATTATKNPTVDMDSPPALESKTPKPSPLSESQISLAAPSLKDSAPPLKDSTFDTTLKPQVPRLLTKQQPTFKDPTLDLTKQQPTFKDPTLDVKEPVLLPVEGEEMTTYIPGVGPAIPIPPTPRQVPSSSLPQPASPAIPIPLISPVHPAAAVQPESDSDSDSGGQDWGDFFDCWG